MEPISFSLSDAFKKAFGYETKAFSPDFPRVSGIDIFDRTNFSAIGSPYYYLDEICYEYFMPATLTYYEDIPVSIPFITAPQSAINTTVTAAKTWALPYPIISISSRKTIVETALTERRGTVKELINVRDYDIVIRGFIIGNNNDFPERDVTTLRTIYEQNMALSIQCPLTDIFLLRPDRKGSDQVVITDLKFPGLKGVKNVCPYELHMVSDEPFNLISIS